MDTNDTIDTLAAALVTARRPLREWDEDDANDIVAASEETLRQVFGGELEDRNAVDELGHALSRAESMLRRYDHPEWEVAREVLSSIVVEVGAYNARWKTARWYAQGGGLIFEEPIDSLVESGYLRLPARWREKGAGWAENVAPYPSPAAISELHAGKKIQAIKLYREETGLGLKEAKETLDNLS